MTRPGPAEEVERVRVVLVSGLSGAGKLSVLRALEDLGFEAVDNSPLAMLGDMIDRARQNLAIGIDARTKGFDADTVVALLGRLRADPRLHAELIFVTAPEPILLRRYSETRRRHPLAPRGRVTDGIAQEQTLLGPLRPAADLVLDTADLPLSAMRTLIERRYRGAGTGAELSVALISFSYAHGLPPDADLVFDARFLRNPHYDPILRSRTGLDPEVAAYIEADPDHASYIRAIQDMLGLLLPRFLQEGKKYATIAVGCTGGRHRSVLVIETLARILEARILGDDDAGWRLTVAHRELAREGLSSAYLTERPAGEGGAPRGEAEKPPVDSGEALLGASPNQAPRA